MRRIPPLLAILVLSGCGCTRANRVPPGHERAPVVEDEAEEPAAEAKGVAAAAPTSDDGR